MTDVTDITEPTEEQINEMLAPIHPGEILLEEFMKPRGLSAYRVAKDIGVPASRIDAILAGKRDITVDTALRLSSYFGVSVQMWLGFQAQYDLDCAKRAGVPNVARCTAPVSSELVAA